MITKFIKIKNVGRWRDYSASDDTTLDKVNIIYGENSQGKTTLVSIIRSLVLNDSELILKRRTFKTNEKQFVKLLFQYNGGKIFLFQDNSWNRDLENLKDIEIFDEFFVNENIYTGMEIQSKHQRCLYQFAIGKEGISLVKSIEQKKEDLKFKKNEFDSLEKQLGTITKKYFNKIDEYVYLTEDKDIEIKIEAKKQEQKIAESDEEIKRKEFLKEIQPFSLPFDYINLKILLGISLTNISEIALQETTEHINKLTVFLENDSEPWIHKGLLLVENIKDNKCPFCQQDLTNAEHIIKLYKQYFNKEYRELKENVGEYLKKNEEINIEQLINDVNIIVLNNNTILEFWKRFIKMIAPENSEFEGYYSQIFENFKKVKSVLGSKCQNILSSMDTVCVDNLITSISDFNIVIKNYNCVVKSINEEITKIKGLQTNTKELKDTIEKLEAKRQRFFPEINKLCEDYQAIKKEINDTRKLITQMEKELKEVISQKAEKYGEETNNFLEKFGIPFRIIKQKPTYRGKGQEPYFEYYLEAEGCEINPLQNAKFTLSGGDRNAFALAFFLAKNIVDGNINEKIIIFDDPISSFDINRKGRTIEFIRDLSQKSKQTIVLTHVDTFAFKLHEALKDLGINPKCLQVINGNIKKWNINEAKKPSFIKNLLKLESFLDCQEEINLNEARRLIRVCLEDKLKFNYFRFFKDLGEECWLGAMVKKLRELKDDSYLKFKYSNKEKVISELGNLCDFSNPSHHSNITTPFKLGDTRNELENYIKSTLTMIYEWL
jgi:wobble nucleotide-excising tRNase